VVACDEVPTVGGQVGMARSGMQGSSTEDIAEKVSPVQHSRVARVKRVRAELVGRQGGGGKARHGVAGWRVDVVSPVQRSQRVEVVRLRVGELDILFAYPSEKVVEHLAEVGPANDAMLGASPVIGP
jgi:hypothetical protein